jgi:hypothetical protein
VDKRIREDKMEDFHIESKNGNNLLFENFTFSSKDVGDWIQQLEEWLVGRD